MSKELKTFWWAVGYLLVIWAIIFIVRESNAADEHFKFVQPFDSYVAKHLKWEDDYTAAEMSDVLMTWTIVSPFLMVLDQNQIGKKFLVMGAAHGTAAGLTQLSKAVTNRTRPNGNGDQSFFSGHTSASFTSASLVCYYDRPNCGLAMVGASLTGYLRIAGNRHWASDVIVGALVGLSIGHNVPIYSKGF